MPLCRGGEPSTTKRAEQGTHLVSYTVSGSDLWTCSIICGLLDMSMPDMVDAVIICDDEVT